MREQEFYEGMKKHFNLEKHQARNYIDKIFLPRVTLDVIKFDKWLHEKFGDYEKEGKSSANIVKEKFGNKAEAFCQQAIKLTTDVREYLKEQIASKRPKLYIIDRITSFLKHHSYAVDQSSLVDSVKKMDYHDRKSLQHYMLEDDPDKVLDILGRFGRGIKVKEVSEKITQLRASLYTKVEWGDSFAKIADKSKLEGSARDRYIAYMTKRWGHREGKDPSYHAEWADRFKNGTEWAVADSEGQAILKEIDPDFYKNPVAEKPAEEGEVKESTAAFNCECLSCEHKMTSTEHCRDIKCPKCGGEMRRAERPGIGALAAKLTKLKENL